MIEGATDIFREQLADTTTVVGVLVLALTIPAVILLGVVIGSGVVEDRLSAYRPVVYMDAGAGAEEATSLRNEMEAWTGVDTVEIREPTDAYEMAKERVGEDEVAELGLSSSMFPYSLVVNPQNPVLGRIDLIARVSGLEARGSVDAVDVPRGRSEQILDFLSWIVIGAGVLLAVCVVLAFTHIRAFVRDLMRRQYAEWRLLVSFGASPREFRRVNVIRGVSIGVLGGLVSFGIMLGSLILWRTYRADLVGVSIGGSGSTWFVLLAPVVLGVLVGWSAGVFAGRESLTEESRPDALGITHLLERHG